MYHCTVGVIIFTNFSKAECAYEFKGLALPCASQPGDIALGSKLAVAPVLSAHAVLKNKTKIGRIILSLHSVD